MAKRLDTRLAVDQGVDYRHSQGQGTGTLLNVSSQGCQIKGAFLFPCGTRLRLRLQLPGEVDSLEIERAAVRWVKDNHFGVTFLELTPEACRCIDRVIERLQETQQPAVLQRQEQMIPSSAFKGWDFGETTAMDEPEIRAGR